MAIKCENCGGNMRYHIKKKQLECVHCGEFAEINQANINKNAEKVDSEYAMLENKPDTALYSCPECGAEVRVFSEETTVFCTYCGKQTFLKERGSTTLPTKIVPFQKDAKDIKTAYEKAIKGKMFVPKNIKNAEDIKEFRGIYIPHWSMSYRAEDDAVFEGQKFYTRGSYNYYEEYDINTKIDGEISDIAFDASEAFNDSIAYEIAPFYTEQEENFHEGYIAGFYADKETTLPEDCDEKAYDVIMEKIKDTLDPPQKRQSSKRINITSIKEYPSLVQTKQELVMFPVWFLTHRNKDRVSYSVMNGQTGKMSMDIPVDKKSFFVFAGILGLALSVLFTVLFSSLLYSVTATSMSYISLVMMLASSFVLLQEMKTIYERDNSIISKPDNKEMDKKKQIKNLTNVVVISLFIICLLPAIFSPIFSGGATKPSLFTVITTIPLLIAQIIFMRKINRYKTNKEHLNILASVIITAIAIVLYVISSANDTIYYLLSAVSCVGIVINCMGCINGFNNLTSRPVPNFFKREGASHEE